MNTVELINNLSKQPVKWLLNQISEHNNIVLSSRIRLARNIANFKFPVSSSNIEKEHITQLLTSAINNANIFKEKLSFNISKCSNVDRRLLLERHLISKEFCSAGIGSILLLDKDESFGIMINEEDHARLQVFAGGLALNELWKDISAKETLLGEHISFAFDHKLGYLTSCPTNIGTGLRSSVMLNLPGLVLTGSMSGIIQGSIKLGMTIRGLYGENSEAIGHMYQISNQTTLGETEEEIIDRLNHLIQQIIAYEQNARLLLLQTKKNFFMDFIGRAYGILKYARIISENDALEHLSAIRTGIDMKMIMNLNLSVINELLISVQNSHLQKLCSRELSASEIDVFRADLIRSKLDRTR